MSLPGRLRRLCGRWLPFLIGALFFPVFAMMLEPLLHIVALKSPLGAVMQNNIWVFGLYGGLAAGLFEETGRLVAFKMVLRNEESPVTALSYGLGHGGMEAFLLVGMAMVNNLLLGMLLMGGGEIPPELAAGRRPAPALPPPPWAGRRRKPPPRSSPLCGAGWRAGPSGGCPGGAVGSARFLGRTGQGADFFAVHAMNAPEENLKIVKSIDLPPGGRCIMTWKAT